ncbi:MAG: hypothetical protein A2Y12_08430 [Planctomycetes bacterium GWF2_42_9]|nr:MAG: hypothetical protein A2Y12_08430 [Planctomycetes bacterium GWF2_42_9]
MDFIKSFMIDFWAMVAEMSPYLLFGFAVAGILKVLIPTSFVQRHLGGRGIWPILKSSLFGIPLPLCSCGVIPVSMSLHKRGASKGATTAFLLSTPQTGVDSLLVTYSLLGPIFTIARPIVALITGIIGGTAVDLLDHKPTTNWQPEPDHHSTSHRGYFKIGFKHAFIVLPRDIGTEMLIGLIIAAIISVSLPDNFFADKIGTGIVSMLAMMLVSVPLYVCATASVPIAVALIAKGLSPGAALVFLICGPETNAAAITMIWRVLGHRTTFIYLSTVVVCALTSGLLLDLLFTNLSSEIHSHYHEMSTSLFGHISAVVLLAILFYGIYRKHHKKTPAPLRTT